MGFCFSFSFYELLFCDLSPQLVAPENILFDTSTAILVYLSSVGPAGREGVEISHHPALHVNPA